MTDKKSFKHISVNDSSDDEVVIQAGAVGAPVHETAEEADTLPQENAIDEADSSLFGDAFDAQTGLYPVTVDDDGEGEDPDVPAPATAAASGATAASSSARTDGYHETTLEDVESSKMGSMQKVVLVVAVLAIVAAIVWYVLR